MLKLRHDTPAEWTEIALADFDRFLQDHAANERKVSQSALKLAAQHPKRAGLVSVLIAVAREELEHFEQVHNILRARGKTLANEGLDPYTSALHKAVKNADVDAYLLDRLVLFGIIEARGCERFSMIEAGLPEGALKDFYADLVRSEARHHATYLQQAKRMFPAERVESRLDALLDLEAEIASGLPLRPALH